MISRKDLAGTWKLVSLEARTTDGAPIIPPGVPGATGLFPWGPSPKGLQIYTEDGYFSATMMHTARPALSTKDVMDPSSDPSVLAVKQALLSTYLSSVGTYEIRGGEELIHHVQVHLFPNEVNGEQRIQFSLSGTRLVTYKPTPPVAFLNGQSAVSHTTWERIQ